MLWGLMSLFSSALTFIIVNAPALEETGWSTQEALEDFIYTCELHRWIYGDKITSIYPGFF